MMKESASDFLDRRNGRAGKATHAATSLPSITAAVN